MKFKANIIEYYFGSYTIKFIKRVDGIIWSYKVFKNKEMIEYCKMFGIEKPKNEDAVEIYERIKYE